MKRFFKSRDDTFRRQFLDFLLLLVLLLRYGVVVHGSVLCNSARVLRWSLFDRRIIRFPLFS